MTAAGSRGEARTLAERIAAADLAGYRRGYESGYAAGQGLIMTRVRRLLDALRIAAPIAWPEESAATLHEAADAIEATNGR